MLHGGQEDLTIFVEDNIGAPLLLHEFMHSIGFGHDNGYANGNPAQGVINNIPYGVQWIMAYNDTPGNHQNWGSSYGVGSAESYGLRGFYFEDYPGSNCP